VGSEPSPLPCCDLDGSPCIRILACARLVQSHITEGTALESLPATQPGTWPVEACHAYVRLAERTLCGDALF
jgi:hypothetical protein